MGICPYIPQGVIAGNLGLVIVVKSNFLVCWTIVKQTIKIASIEFGKWLVWSWRKSLRQQGQVNCAILTKVCQNVGKGSSSHNVPSSSWLGFDQRLQFNTLVQHLKDNWWEKFPCSSTVIVAQLWRRKCVSLWLFAGVVYSHLLGCCKRASKN